MIPDAVAIGVLRKPPCQRGHFDRQNCENRARGWAVNAGPAEVRPPTSIDAGIPPPWLMADVQAVDRARRRSALHGGTGSLHARRPLQRLPAIYGFREYVACGRADELWGDLAEHFRRAAAYVDKILKGEKPADLPVECATKFETVVNLKTAKALGI